MKHWLQKLHQRLARALAEIKAILVTYGGARLVRFRLEFVLNQLEYLYRAWPPERHVRMTNILNYVDRYLDYARAHQARRELALEARGLFEDETIDIDELRATCDAHWIEEYARYYDRLEKWSVQSFRARAP